jgi:hypothetical protein
LHSKKLLWVFGIIGLAAVLAMVIAVVLTHKSKTPVQTKPIEVKVNKQDVAVDQLPNKFPADMPQEKGATVTQNYNVTTTDGRFQATRVFETAKTLDDNYKLYKTYFQTNGWQLSTGQDTKDLKVLVASKNDLQAQVTINYNQVTKKTTVGVTVTQISH